MWKRPGPAAASAPYSVAFPVSSGRSPTILTLQANGQTIGTAKDDDGVESANIGVRVGSSESFVTLRFDDFLLKYL
jgi:hypothetical protein